jgi:outer membrane receptor protein involved in Fe transport
MVELQAGRREIPFRPKTLAVAVSAAIAGVHDAAAQNVMEEIVVTATKREANLQDLPQSITAFTTDDISRRGFEGLDDYSKFVPTLSFGRREPGGTSIVFRGVASSGLQFDSNPSSAVYLDEQPITEAGVNPDPRLVDIERVEALSGPQGTLFGDASQSGTLRIITNKPDASGFDSWLEVDGSVVDSGDAGYDVSAMVNVPLADTLALRLVGFRAEEAGFVDNVLAASPGGTKDNSALVEDNLNTSKYTGGRAALRWTPDDRWTVDASAIYQKLEIDDGFGDTNLDVGDLEQVRFSPEKSQDEWYQLALTIDAKLGFADALITGAYFNRELRYEADATDYQFNFQESIDRTVYYGVYNFGGDPIAYAFNDNDNDRWTIEARLSTPSDSMSRWQGLLGVFYNKVESETLFMSGNDDFPNSPAFYYLSYIQAYDPTIHIGPALPRSFAPTNNWFFGTYDSTIEQVAVFGEVSFDFTENFIVTVGGRWYHVDQDTMLMQGGMVQGEVPNFDTDLIVTNESAADSESGFVPKVNATYHFDENKLVYFTYSQGFRRGGTNAVRRTSILPNAYDSDKLTNFEWGAKTTWLDGRFRANLTVYWMQWDDFQIQVEDPQPLVFANAIVNFPEAEVIGVEAVFGWLPAEGWDVTASVAYNDAEISKSAELFADIEPLVVEKGQRLPITPDWKASLSVEYGFPQQLLGAAPYVRFDYAYTGDSINSLAGIEAAIFGQSPTPQDDYHTGDFKIGLDAEKWTASFYIDNIWDERGENFYNNRWVKQRLSINQPRTFGITLMRRFY